MKVRVHRNIHTKKYSISAVEGPNKGLVIAWADEVELENAKFKVSEAGRNRVIRQARKNVHAFVFGDLHTVRGLRVREAATRRERDALGNAQCGVFGLSMCEGVRIGYNPYKASHFQAQWGKDEFTPIVGAQIVHLDPTGGRGYRVDGAPIKLS